MAVAAQSLSFYNDASLFAQTPSTPTLMMNDNGTVSFGSSTLPSSGQSLLSSFGDPPCFTSGWPELFPAYPPSSFFSSSVPLSSEPLYPAEDQSADLLLMGTDSDFLNQINGVAAVMHPNLVSTLKNMVAPGSPRGGGSSQFAYHSFLDQQPTPHEAQLQLGSSLFSHSEVKPSVTTVAADASAVPQICSQPLKVEKSETEDNIEAAVVSVDLIQNRRPFRCQHDGCNKTFKNPQTMKMHHKTHYTDGSAGSKAGMLALPTLSSSLKAGHNKKIPSRCPKCKKTFVGLYELRRHYGRKHSEGEKPFGCRKCSKKFYIEVDVRDHEKLCGEPIECKCGLKFAFKCNLVAHKKAHPACQDQQQTSPSSSTSGSSSGSGADQSPSSSSDSDQSRGGSSSSSPASGRGTRRPREETLSPSQSMASLHSSPLPDLKDIPEAPHFKCARYDFSGLAQFSSPGTQTTRVPYPQVPTFSHFNPMSMPSLFPTPQHSGLASNLASLKSLHQQPYFSSFSSEAYGNGNHVVGLGMGSTFHVSSSSLQGMVQLN